MKKLILFGFIALFTLSHAKMVNAIALIVDGEPVTTAEIRAVEEQVGVDREKAIELLTQDRLQKAAMKNISISEDAVDGKVSQIAAQNNISVQEMQKVLKEKGTTWTKYRSTIRDSMKREKFFREKIASTIPAPSDDELKIYYENHQEEFILPASISMIEYSAASEKTIKNFLQTKNTKSVKSRSVTKKTKDINPALLSTILQTQDGSFTRPFNTGDKYISYKILSKEGQTEMPFETAKAAVTASWRRQRQDQAVKDYFQKMKTEADIQVIRE